MEEGASSISRIESIHLSLQIIIIILTIIKLFINFYENEYNILFIIDVVINLIILIFVTISPLFAGKHFSYLCILMPCWPANFITGLILSSFFVSNEFLGIYYFAVVIRTFFIFSFFVISGFYHEKPKYY